MYSSFSKLKTCLIKNVLKVSISFDLRYFWGYNGLWSRYRGLKKYTQWLVYVFGQVYRVNYLVNQLKNDKQKFYSLMFVLESISSADCFKSQFKY